MEQSEIKLYHGDCLQVLDQLPDNLVDLVLTDPPYSTGGTYASQRAASTRKKYTGDAHNGAARFPNFSGDNMDQRSYTEFMRTVLFKAREKTKPGGIVGCFIDWRNLPAMTDALQMAGWVWRGIVVWDKKSSRPQRGRYRNQCEYVVWGSNGGLPLDRGVNPLPGMYTHCNVPTQKRHHQTEKPVELMKELLKIVPVGSLVLDPFMGSGSTGKACLETGRGFIGIEMGNQYFKTAQDRLHT